MNEPKIEPSWKKNLLDQMQAKGFSMKSLSVAAGLGDTFIRDVVKRDRTPSLDKFALIAKTLGVTVSDLMGNSDTADAELGLSELRVSTAEVSPVVKAGRVAAGVFLEVDEFDQSEPQWTMEPTDPLFPNARRMSFEVDGDSVNALKPRPIMDGDTVICVSFEDVASQVKVRDGMVVVVQRTRDGGHTREWSVKQIEFYEDRIEFHPRSTNPKHKPIVVARDYQADEGTQVEIIGLVRRVSNEFPI